MKPESSSATDQAKEQKAKGLSGNTANLEDIPAEHRDLEGVKEDITEGSLPESSGKPRVSPANEGRRNVNRGLHS